MFPLVYLRRPPPRLLLRDMPLLREDDILREPRSWLAKEELRFIPLEELKALLVLGPESRETWRLAILSPPLLVRFEGVLARLRSLVAGFCLSPPALRSLERGFCRSVRAGCWLGLFVWRLLASL